MAYADLTPTQRSEIYNVALHCVDGERQMIEEYGLTQAEFEELMLDEGADKCEYCDNWVEASELLDRNDDVTGCTDCREAGRCDSDEDDDW